MYNNENSNASISNNAVQSTVAAESPAIEQGNGPRPVQDSSTSYANAPSQATEMSMEWVMAKMDAIIHNNQYLTNAIETLHSMTTNGHDSKAQALGEAIAAREETNRQTLKFLEKIYDGLKPAPLPPADPGAMLKHIDMCELAEHMNSEDLVEMMRVIFRSA